MNSSQSRSHSSANRNNSVFEEINKGDDFEDMIDDINKEGESSDNSDGSEDSGRVQRRAALKEPGK